MIRFTLAAAAIAVTGAAADAAQLDFTAGVLSGGNTVLTMPEAVLTAGSGATLIVGDFVANASCAIIPASGCVGVMTLTWNFDVENVSFDYGFGNDGDFATVTALDASMATVGSVFLDLESGTANEDISALGVFRSLVFDNTGAAGAGYSYGNVNFDRAIVDAPIPLPAALPLLMGGIAGLALLRRKPAA
ncbi:VPLPA-CTERM sorting domain-containing protein [Meridianimarinicoccus sp. RP-17]|uniref:VPLPA-CTERM sorting domain-containing protein n=1 Tax=Meridianimarinicoccus zhengii TaxID=2056810 RepID=UPI000DAD04A9|nr:VPLPA-CTERM sorting domain-containing protein [Phycocomes zhengii]